MWLQAFARITGPAFVLVLAACNAAGIPAIPTPLEGGPGDATAIRVCRLGGQGRPQPWCFIDPTTGPFGCARCVVNPECH